MNPILILFFVAAALLRGGALLVSVRHEKALKAQGATEYGRRNSQLLAGAHTLFYAGAGLEGLWRHTQPTLWTMVGLGLYGIALLAFLLVVRELGRFWTVKVLIASDHVLNQRALFRWVRHPNYFVNMLPEVVGLALIMGAWSVLMIGFPLYLLVLRRRIMLEEQAMRAHFPSYAQRPWAAHHEALSPDPPPSARQDDASRSD